MHNLISSGEEPLVYNKDNSHNKIIKLEEIQAIVFKLHNYFFKINTWYFYLKIKLILFHIYVIKK